MEEAYLEYNHMVIRYQGNLNLIKDLDGCDVLGKSNLFLLCLLYTSDAADE